MRVLYVCLKLHAESTFLHIVGRLLLKRYYNFLWKNFPQDHLVSLGRFCKLVPLSDDVVDIIVSSSPDEGNQKLLNICVVTIENDKSLPRFCSLVEHIIDNPKLSQLLKIFRDGEDTCNITTMHLQLLLIRV